MAESMVYLFDEVEEGNTSENVRLLGNKGAQLAEMKRIGIPVPPGFTITTNACISFYENGMKWPENLEDEVTRKLKMLEEKTGKKLGSKENPLFLSVRSGSYVSMPGMMDTVLNLGMNDETVEAFANMTEDSRGAWDSYRRFIQMFGDVVMGIKHEKFEDILERMKNENSVSFDYELRKENIQEIVREYKKLIESEKGKSFPSDVREQLKMAIDAVFNSWNNERAVKYRKINGLKDDAGTGVNVQSMVFGNIGKDCATGVGFTRNPSTGKKEHYGEYLINAQGEDVVAGIRTPKHIDELKDDIPDAFERLVEIYELLEKHYKEMQDFEFTIERGKLFILQTRKGKRTAHAAVKISVDMVKEGMITREDALLRVEPDSLNQLLHERIDPDAKYEILAEGLAASPGAATGKAVFEADDAVEMAEEGEDVILVRNETSPEDIHGMHVSKGILTARGGMTSHAAVVARGMGKPCVSGCEKLRIEKNEKRFMVGETEIKEGDFITIDGGKGHLIPGKIKTIEPSISGEFKEFMEWADEIRNLGVRTNADTPKDSKIARDFGAEGIGLCRTEHMFFSEDRLPWMQKMIMAESKEDREESLNRIMSMQKEDFKGLFKVMDGLPVTIRLLDPPLHEFLPNYEDLLVKIAEAKVSGGNTEDNKRMLKIVEDLKESNPMLGNRGCRLGITFPEIYEMQVNAIFEAACESAKEGLNPMPEIMIPLVSHVNELRSLREMVVKRAEDILNKNKSDISFTVGTMIELPRACVTADEIAEQAEFFSFGTNDLTQTTFGFSRDDAEGKFLQKYKEIGILESDPFEVLDSGGVGELVKIAVRLGRSKRKGLKVGICGEHGGEPRSVDFCHVQGLDYVSCSPFRVPIARLAAAHASIRNKK